MSWDGLWCAGCEQDMPYLTEASCPICALPSPSAQVCGHCLREPPAFDRALALYRYAFPADALVQAMKFREQLALADEFAKYFVAHCVPDTMPELLIPMPLHPAKLRTRGFNQSLLFAQGLSRRLHIPSLQNACRRVRDTPPQSSLSWDKRRKNVRNAFECMIDLQGKHVALVDDVLTTGASMNALAEAVRKRGAKRIDVWVIARTMPHR
jgi:ComF family protein